MSGGIPAAIFLSITLAAVPGCGQGEPPARPPGLFKVQVDGKWGFIDQDGDMVREPRFDRAFGTARTRVTARDATGWVSIELKGDKRGVTLTRLSCKPDAEAVVEIGGGLYRVFTDASWDAKIEIYDSQGKFKAKYDDDWAWGILREGRLPIKQGGKHGAVDRNGRLVIEPKYDALSSFSEGKAKVRFGDKWGYVDRDGKLVLEFDRGGGFVFAEGCAAIAGDDNLMRFIKPDGTPAFDRRFHVAWGFSEGLAAVGDATKRFGYIDHTGEYVIEPKYDMARDFSDGLAAVEVASGSNGKKTKVAGYINSKGEMVIQLANPVEFYSFRRGLALVQTAEWMGYIDKSGRVIWKTSTPWTALNSEQEP
ncbi:MAG: WG repeat-containing protein [Pirellulales bacterium]